MAKHILKTLRSEHSLMKCNSRIDQFYNTKLGLKSEHGEAISKKKKMKNKKSTLFI